MGSKPKDIATTVISPVTGGLQATGRAIGIDKLDPGKAPREAARQAKRAQEEQASLLREQTKQEKLKRTIAASDVAERGARARKPGGRSLLIATSPRGVTRKLGGTT